ncbi:MAG: PIN domain-containing protein [Chitinivibrionia bacterium]|nr:PIN domain-containing protein [Chitinivibrionia bacterium]
MRIYLDNCCYNRPFDEQNQMRIFLEAQAKMYIQDLVILKKLDLVYSYMSVYENNDNPYENRRNIILDFFNNASLFVDFDIWEIIEKRAEIIMNLGIKNKDAIHISCALEAKCDYFITTDDKILKNYKENDIIICSPINFISDWEEKNA